MAEEAEELTLLNRRALQFLVHCFLYYKLAEPVVSDEFFDRVTGELRTLRARHPEAPMPHADLVDSILGPESSGFQIRQYPPAVITTAFKLLYAATDPGADFREFVERRGYRVESAEAGGDGAARGEIQRP